MFDWNIEFEITSKGKVRKFMFSVRADNEDTAIILASEKLIEHLKEGDSNVPSKN